jgi:hypothetical protein
MSRLPEEVLSVLLRERPDFLWTLAALASFMRLSLLKAAHAVLDGATYRKSGTPVFGQGGRAAGSGSPPGLLFRLSDKIQSAAL